MPRQYYSMLPASFTRVVSRLIEPLVSCGVDALQLTVTGDFHATITTLPLPESPGAGAQNAGSLCTTSLPLMLQYGSVHLLTATMNRQPAW